MELLQTLADMVTLAVLHETKERKRAGLID